MNTSDEDRQRLLSPEELAAMADDDYDADEDNAAALAEIGRGAMEGEGEDLEDAPDKLTQDAVPEADAPDADDAAGQPAKDEPAQEGRPAPAAHQPAGYSVELPEDFDDQLKANKTAAGDLRKKFNDGDLDQAEYDAALDALQDAREGMLELRARARISAEMRQQSEQDAWANTINTFVADAASKAELGIVDYKKDAAKQADLDVFVKALAAAKGNESKPMRWFLEEAHRRVVALHSVPTAKKAPDPKRRPDASEVVQNLADVPGGAGDADPASSEFAELDKLTGPAYERALAAMPQDKRDRYLMSA